LEGDAPVPLAGLHRELAFGMHAAYAENQRIYERLVRILRLASLLVALDALAVGVGLGAG
jgi:hypothetical protein